MKKTHPYLSSLNLLKRALFPLFFDSSSVSCSRCSRYVLCLLIFLMLFPSPLMASSEAQSLSSSSPRRCGDLFSSLKPFQIEALKTYHQIRDQKESYSQKLLVVAPGGTGKTLVIDYILRDWQKSWSDSSSQRKPFAVVVTNQTLLLNQLQSQLQISQVSIQKWGDGVSVSTLKESFLKQLYQDQLEPQLVFATDISFKLMIKSLSESQQNLFTRKMDLLVYDEAHHMGASEIKQIVEKISQTQDGPFLLGATATPFHHETNLQSLYDNQVFWSYLASSGKDSLTLGRSFVPQPYAPHASHATDESHTYHVPQVSHIPHVPLVSQNILRQLRQAIQQGDVTPIEKIYVLNSLDYGVSQGSLVTGASQKRVEPLFISERQGRGAFRQVLNPLLYSEIFSSLSPLIEKQNPGFIVASTITEAQRIYEYVTRQFPHRRFALLHSKLPPGEVKRLFQNVRDGFVDFTISVRMLDEGLDLPPFRTYVDLTPSVSLRQLMQRIYRTTRLYPGKSSIHIGLFFSVTEKTVQESLQILDHLIELRTVSEPFLRDLSQGDFQFQERKEPSKPNSKLKAFDEIQPVLITEDILSQEGLRLRQSLQSFWQSTKPHAPLIQSETIQAEATQPTTTQVTNTQAIGTQLLEAGEVLPSPSTLRSPKAGFTHSERRDFHLRELTEFFATHKRLPLFSSSHESEKKLASWLTRLKYQYRETWLSYLDPEVSAYIQKQNLDKQIKNTEERLKELEAFILEHQSLPTQSYRKYNEGLAQWFQTWRSYNKENWEEKLSTPARELIRLHDLKPYPLKKALDQKIEGLNVFIIENKRLPSRQAPRSHLEKELGLWLTTLKNDKKESWDEVLNPQAREILETYGLKRHSYKEKIVELESFIQTHRRLPSPKSLDILEKKLGLYVVYFKKTKGRDSWFEVLSPSTQDLLTSEILNKRKKRMSKEKLK
jgi:superfamily II DNA or RNA helicase